MSNATVQFSKIKNKKELKLDMKISNKLNLIVVQYRIKTKTTNYKKHPESVLKIVPQRRLEDFSQLHH